MTSHLKRPNQGWTYRDRVERAGQTLLDYYSQTYRHSSPEEWQARIAAGQILLDGQPALPETRLQVGQQLTYRRPPWVEPDVPLEFEVLYEDADLLLINKPAGLPVLPGGGFLDHTLLGQLQRRYAEATPYPIHRLGRGTSGLMLLARSSTARAHLSQQMRQHQIHKVYRALVGDSTAIPDSFTITQPIGKLPHPVLGYIYGATADGAFAQSEGRVLQRRSGKSATLLEVVIRTGRPHQIRIHLAALGYPLLGDPLYGPGGLPRLPQSEAEKLPVPGDCGYHLHAHAVSFQHPRTDERLNFSCTPPPLLQVSS